MRMSWSVRNWLIIHSGRTISNSSSPQKVKTPRPVVQIHNANFCGGEKAGYTKVQAQELYARNENLQLNA